MTDVLGQQVPILDYIELSATLKRLVIAGIQNEVSSNIAQDSTKIGLIRNKVVSKDKSTCKEVLADGVIQNA